MLFPWFDRCSFSPSFSSGFETPIIIFLEDGSFVDAKGAPELFAAGRSYDLESLR